MALLTGSYDFNAYDSTLNPKLLFTRSCKSTLGTPLKTPSLVKIIQLAYFALAGAPLTSSNQT